MRHLVFVYPERTMSSVRTDRTYVGGAGRTRIARDRIDSLGDHVIPVGTKGLPLGLGDITVREFARSGLSVLGGHVPMPVAVLKSAELNANITAMQEFCDRNGVLLCPHGKTTLAPQLFARQIEAGAWGITAATPAQLRMYRSFGVDRIIYANEMVEPVVLAWLATELNAYPNFEFYCLVDSVPAVEILSQSLAAAGLVRPINVLVEVGYAGGRCGVRDLGAAAEVAAAVDSSKVLHLAGVECFEGLLPADRGDMSVIDGFLHTVTGVAEELVAHSSLARAESFIISAGGSAFFDRVIEQFCHTTTFDVPAQIVLRSGCSITQDGGFYAQMSPLAGRADGAPALSNAIEVWGAVLSRPESGLVVVSMGRRDCSYDMGLPAPHRVVVDRSAPNALTGAEVIAMSDQHAHIRVPDRFTGGPGDLMGFAVSHPCTTFDKWKILPIVDDDYRIIDAVVTAF